MSQFANVIGGIFLLNDGKEMPKVGLGTSGILTQKEMDVAVETALKSGYRLFDTANLYINEHFLGTSLKKFLPVFDLKREDIFITTKVRIVNQKTAEEIEKQLNASFVGLQTNYIDLLLIHFPRDRDFGCDDDYEKNRESRKTVWQLLEKFQKNKLLYSIGVSNYEVYHLVELFEYAKIPPAVNQYEYHPFMTRPTLKKFCENSKIVVQAYSSLCGNNKLCLESEPVVRLAQKHSTTVQTILYAFALCSNTSILPKSTSPTRIHDNLHRTLQVNLSAEEIASLNTLDQHKSFQNKVESWRCM